MSQSIVGNSTVFTCDSCPRDNRKKFRLMTTNMDIIRSQFRHTGWGAQPGKGGTWRHLCPECYRIHKAEVAIRRERRKEKSNDRRSRNIG